jgi:hypothetical protein
MWPGGPECWEYPYNYQQKAGEDERGRRLYGMKRAGGKLVNNGQQLTLSLIEIEL